MFNPEEVVPAITNGEVEETVLTCNERDTLALSARGHHLGTIADMLGQPPAKVRSSLLSVCTKLGAHSKLEAIVIGLRKGLIDPPRP